MTAPNLSTPRKPLWLYGIVLTLAFLGIGCDSGGDDEAGEVTIQGQVLDDNNNPVPEAVVRLDPPGVFLDTDDQGRYSTVVELDSASVVNVQVSKNGFTSSNTQILAIPGRVVDVPTLRINETISSGPISGEASNIQLGSQSAANIGVKESGSPEVTTLEFIVSDSLGRPVTLDNAVDVVFSLGQQPGGGEFIWPERVRTDNNGLVEVNLSSGTRAGVVQIVAEAQVGGTLVRSLPVSVAIHGGLPDAEHFSLGPAFFNFPGYRTYGLTNAISVIVGDKYSNPVRPNTVVYFSSSHGVIEGSTATNEQGRGSVNLISGEPLPPDGVATVTATTADENQDAVSARTPVVFSGVPTITIDPQFLQVGQTYVAVVADGRGNPLVQGTTISVTVEGTNVKCIGLCEKTLDDTAFRADALADGVYNQADVVTGPSITEFRFVAVADNTGPEAEPPVLQSITVSTSGPNGALDLVLGGDSVPKTTTPGASMEVLPDGTVRFTAGKD